MKYNLQLNKNRANDLEQLALSVRKVIKSDDLTDEEWHDQMADLARQMAEAVLDNRDES